jgi:outer membrane protein OmpA-like peptidoglycan-associated protein
MRWLLFAAVWTLPSLGYADPIELQLRNQVPPGQKPSLTIKALAPVTGVQAELTREDDGRQFKLTHGPLREGQSATLPFGDGQGGHARWKGTLTILLGDGNRVTNQVTFETAVLGDLKVTYRRDRLDLDGRVLEFQLSRPAGRAELHVFGDDGKEIGHGEATYDKEPPGTWLRIGWQTSRPANVLRLELRAVDAQGAATLVKLLPWSVRIQHEEVVFPTGQSTILPSEEAKLDASYGKIIDAVAYVRRAEPNLPVRLFIAGHTDTVGRTDDNRRLSLERARAIGAWFRDRGLPLPIEYAGFGEDALKVKTPDDTDEAANRRADYIVGVEAPPVARGVRAAWVVLR